MNPTGELLQTTVRFTPLRGRVRDTAVVHLEESNCVPALSPGDYQAISQLCAVITPTLRGRRVREDNTAGHPADIFRLLSAGGCFTVEIDTSRWLAIDVDVPSDDLVTDFVAVLVADGHHPVVFASGQHGRRHIWCHAGPTDLAAYRAMISNVHGWDDRQSIRPPGVNHRTGIAPRILWGAKTWDQAADALGRPSPQQQFSDSQIDAMVQKIAEKTRSAATARAEFSARRKRANTPQPQTESSTPVLSSHMKKLVTLGNVAAPPFCFRTGLRTHRPSCGHGGRCYASVSEALQAVFTAAVQIDGFTMASTLGYIHREGRQGLGAQIEESENRRGEHNVGKWFERSWIKAEQRVKQIPPTNASRPESLNRFANRLHTASLLTPMATSAFTVLRAFMQAARRNGTVDGFAVDVDRLNIDSGLANSTVSKAIDWLLQAGWLQSKWTTNSIYLANRWKLLIPIAQADIIQYQNTIGTNAVPNSATSDPSHDAWCRNALGKTGWYTLQVLQSRGDATAKEIGDVTGRSPDTIRRDLNQLAAHQIITRTNQKRSRSMVWSATPGQGVKIGTELENAAVRYKTVGRKQRSRLARCNRQKARGLRQKMRQSVRETRSLRAGWTKDGHVPTRAVTNLVRRHGETLAAAWDRTRYLDRLRAEHKLLAQT